jgi:hypothetical protein
MSNPAVPATDTHAASQLSYSSLHLDDELKGQIFRDTRSRYVSIRAAGGLFFEAGAGIIIFDGRMVATHVVSLTFQQLVRSELRRYGSIEQKGRPHMAPDESERKHLLLADRQTDRLRIGTEGQVLRILTAQAEEPTIRSPDYPVSTQAAGP